MIFFGNKLNGTISFNHKLNKKKTEKNLSNNYKTGKISEYVFYFM